jgi:hypothetical protein
MASSTPPGSPPSNYGGIPVSETTTDANETLTDLEREVLDEYVKLRDNLEEVSG